MSDTGSAHYTGSAHWASRFLLAIHDSDPILVCFLKHIKNWAHNKWDSKGIINKIRFMQISPMEMLWFSINRIWQCESNNIDTLE